LARSGHSTALDAAAVVLRRDPAFTIKKWLHLHQFVKQAHADRVVEGLRLARFPE
jgi:hypothetical protein